MLAAGLSPELKKISAATTAAGQARKFKGLFQIPIEAQSDPLFNYRRSSFSPYLGSIFSITLNDANATSLAVTLVELGDTGFPKAGKRIRRPTTDVINEDRFSLLFRGPLEVLLGQGVYTVNHGALGRFRLLLVPILTGRTDAHYYEAIINRQQT